MVNKVDSKLKGPRSGWLKHVQPFRNNSPETGLKGSREESTVRYDV